MVNKSRCHYLYNWNNIIDTVPMQYLHQKHNNDNYSLYENKK